MNRKAREFRHQSLQDPHSLVEYLRALQDGFAKGSLQFRDDGGEITLEPTGLIRFEVNASKKSGQHGLTLKFSWKQPEPDEKDPGPLLINGTQD
jgi:amphi-Trp domain-containing protein